MTRNQSCHTGTTGMWFCLVALCSFGCSPGFLPLPIEQCFPPPNPDGELRLRGNVLDADTLQGLKGADVAALLITEGVETTRATATGFLTEEDGAFLHALIAKGPQCAVVPDLPIPDQLKVIVTIDGCEQTFLIDINEDTVVDLDFPDRVIELKEPILVAACE